MENLLKNKFKAIKTDSIELAASERVLNLFEDFLSTEFCADHAKPIFRYESKPDEKFRRDLSVFMMVCEDKLEELKTFALPKIEKIVVKAGKNLRVSLHCERFLNEEAEGNLLQARKSLKNLRLYYSKNSKTVGFTVPLDVVKQVGVEERRQGEINV